MLTDNNLNIELSQVKEEASSLLPEEYRKFLTMDTEPLSLTYPGILPPQSLKSFSLDKEPRIKGKLVAIKGQYLVFSDGKVFNVRKHGGYYVRFVY
jgi:hypothetical protein